MPRELRQGGFVKNPVGVLKVARDKDGRNTNFVTRGKDAVTKVIQRVTGRKANVLQVSHEPLDRVKAKAKGHDEYYKNAADIPEHKRAPKSNRDPNSALAP